MTILRINSEEEFMMAAFSCESEDELPELKGYDRFYDEIYLNILSSIYYHFKQFTFLFYVKEFAWRSMQTIESKLELQLDALTDGLDYVEKYIKVHLLSKKHDQVSGAVFVLSSLEGKHLDIVLEKFPEVEDDYIKAWVKGLKHGRNQSLTDILFALLETCPDKIRSACFEIIRYRADYTSDQFEQYKKHLESAFDFSDTTESKEPKTLKQLIEEMDAEKNSYESRKKAWRRFIIQSKQKIAFEPDWPVEKQKAAILECKQIIIQEEKP